MSSPEYEIASNNDYNAINQHNSKRLEALRKGSTNI